MDSALEKEVVVLKVPGLPGNRLVFASTGPVNRDYDDVRRFSDAAASGMKRSDVCPHHVTVRHHRPSCLLHCLAHLCVLQGLESRHAAPTAGLPSAQGL